MEGDRRAAQPQTAAEYGPVRLPSRFDEGGDDGQGARLELMTAPGLAVRAEGDAAGWAHVAVTVGSREAVDALAARMAGGGVSVVSHPRTTGDGYYEAVVRDPDGNLVEIAA